MSVVRVSLPYLEIAAHHNLFLLQLKKYISVRLDFSFGKKKSLPTSSRTETPNTDFFCQAE